MFRFYVVQPTEYFRNFVVIDKFDLEEQAQEYAIACAGSMKRGVMVLEVVGRSQPQWESFRAAEPEQRKEDE